MNIFCKFGYAREEIRNIDWIEVKFLVAKIINRWNQIVIWKIEIPYDDETIYIEGVPNITIHYESIRIRSKVRRFIDKTYGDHNVNYTNLDPDDPKYD